MRQWQKRGREGKRCSHPQTTIDADASQLDPFLFIQNHPCEQEYKGNQFLEDPDFLEPKSRKPRLERTP